jgi:hypothetical protein
MTASAISIWRSERRARYEPALVSRASAASALARAERDPGPSVTSREAQYWLKNRGARRVAPGSRLSLATLARPGHEAFTSPWARYYLGIAYAPDEKSAELPRTLRTTASTSSEVISSLACPSGRARNARRLKIEAITHRGWSSPLIASLSMTALRARMCRSASSRRRRLSSGVIAPRFDNTLLHVTAVASRVRMMGDGASKTNARSVPSN